MYKFIRNLFKKYFPKSILETYVIYNHIIYFNVVTFIYVLVTDMSLMTYD